MKLLQKVDIPLKPKPSIDPSEDQLKSLEIADGTSATGKRKREGEEGDSVSDASNEPSAKRPASKPMSNADNSEPIVLDDDEEGPIAIDD